MIIVYNIVFSPYGHYSYLLGFNFKTTSQKPRTRFYTREKKQNKKKN